LGNQIVEYSPELYKYILAHSVLEHPSLAKLRKATSQMQSSRMQISPDLGQLIKMLIKISGATKTLDIGTFTGYSALAAALALPSNGKVVTCDIDPRHSKMAESAWQEAGVGDRIELKVAPAVDTLE